MPKIVGPPPIANLDGIIDLLTNSEKYAAYLQDLKQLHDNIKVQCEIYDTKEQADAYVRQASHVLSDAQEQAKQLLHEQESIKARHEAEHAQAMQAISLRAAGLERREQDEREAGQAVAAKERVVVGIERELADRKAKLDAREEHLRVRSLELDRQEDRIKKATETLTSLGM